MRITEILFEYLKLALKTVFNPFSCCFFHFRGGIILRNAVNIHQVCKPSFQACCVTWSFLRFITKQLSFSVTAPSTQDITYTRRDFHNPRCSRSCKLQKYVEESDFQFNVAHKLRDICQKQLISFYKTRHVLQESGKYNNYFTRQKSRFNVYVCHSDLKEN